MTTDFSAIGIEQGQYRHAWSSHAHGFGIAAMILEMDTLRISKRSGYSREVIVLLRRAATLGDGAATFELGVLLRDGQKDAGGRIIVRRDRNAALRFFRRAAEQGK